MTTEGIKEALEYAVELRECGQEIVKSSDGTEYYDSRKFSLTEFKTLSTNSRIINFN